MSPKITSAASWRHCALALSFFLFLVGSTALACGLSPAPPPPTPAHFNLGPTSVNSGLADLQSYRTQLVVDFNGRRNGDTTQGHLETLTEVTRQPDGLHHYVQFEGRLPQSPLPAGVSEFYRLADRVYLKKAGDTLWSQFSDPEAGPSQFGFFELGQLIVLPRSVTTPPITLTLNGLAGQRYTFTQADLSDPDLMFDQAQGEVFVTTDGGYVAQYVISASITTILPLPNAHLFDRGQLNLRYTLTDANAGFTLTPPTDAPTTNVLANLPRLPDASLTATFPTLIEYTSAITAVAAAQFYQDTLTGQGWTQDEAALFNEKARLVFSKAGQSLTVIITPADVNDKIKVTLSNTP